MGNYCSAPSNRITMFPIQEIDMSQRAKSQNFCRLYPKMTHDHSQMYLSPRKRDPNTQTTETSPYVKPNQDPVGSTRKFSLDIEELEKLEIGPFYLKNDLENFLKKKSHAKRERIMTKWEKASHEAPPEDAKKVLLEQGLYTQEEISLKKCEFSHPGYFERMLKNGIPTQYRSAVWKILLKPHRYFVPGLYERLKDLSSPCERQIRKDVHRTFPLEKYYFRHENTDEVGQKQLYNVLRALSIYFPNISYTQGMNFIAGILLLVNGGDELQAFWTFVALARDPRFLIMGLFERGFMMIKFFIFVFFEILERKMPELCAHMKKEDLPSELWVFRWFLMMFIHIVPMKDAVKMWDFILQKGFFGMIRIALGLMKELEKDLLILDGSGMNSLFKNLCGVPPSKQENKGQPVNSNLSTAENLDDHIVHVSMKPPGRKGSIETREFILKNEFREINTDFVVGYARKVHLSIDETKKYIALFEKKGLGKIPEPYCKIMKDLSEGKGDWKSFKETQDELDFYLLNQALKEKVDLDSSLEEDSIYM